MGTLASTSEPRRLALERVQGSDVTGASPPSSWLALHWSAAGQGLCSVLRLGAGRSFTLSFLQKTKHMLLSDCSSVE